MYSSTGPARAIRSAITIERVIVRASPDRSDTDNMFTQLRPEA